MTIWITLLILLGLLLFVAELVLLPGITLAAVGSFCCLVAAVTWAFVGGSVAMGFIVLGIVVVFLGILMAMFLRPKTWNRVALKTNIESQVQAEDIQNQVEVGVQGSTLTRLAPMGKVQVGDRIFEAKSLDSYIDPRRQVVVIGYENSNIIVRPMVEE